MAVSLYSWSCVANIYSGGTLAYIASKSGQNLIADGQQHSGYVTMPAYSAIPARSIIWSGAVPRGNKLRSCRK